MYDGFAHCRSNSVEKIFETIKQRFNAMFDFVITLRIGMYNFAHVGVMDTAKFSFGHLQTFQKIRNSAKIACAESIFTVYGKMFSSCVVNRVADLTVP